MLWCGIARLQPVARLMHSVLLYLQLMLVLLYDALDLTVSGVKLWTAMEP